jgi:hypothetical protein
MRWNSESDRYAMGWEHLTLHIVHSFETNEKKENRIIAAKIAEQALAVVLNAKRERVRIRATQPVQAQPQSHSERSAQHEVKNDSVSYGLERLGSRYAASFSAVSLEDCGHSERRRGTTIDYPTIAGGRSRVRPNSLVSNSAAAPNSTISGRSGTTST